MKAAIILALIGSVLAAPPIRQMQRPDHDQYSHIFAEVRPAGQKPQNMELQYQLHHVVEGEQTQERLPVEEEHHQHHHEHHEVSGQGQLVNMQMRPVEQKPQHAVEVEIKEHRPQEQKHQYVELEISQQLPHSAPNHLVDVELKPVEHKPQHVMEVEIKQQQQKPQHVEFEIKQQQPHHFENSAQGHLVSLDTKPVHQKPQHFEFDLSVDQQVELPQHLELELGQDNSQNGILMMSGQRQ